MSEHIISLSGSQCLQRVSFYVFRIIDQSKPSDELGKAYCGTLDQTVKYHTSSNIRACTYRWYNPTSPTPKPPSELFQTHSLTPHDSHSTPTDS